VKVGDLVTRTCIHRTEPDITKETLGIIVEWEPDYTDCGRKRNEGAGWVKWSTHPDFSIEYETDLELINENR